MQVMVDDEIKEIKVVFNKHGVNLIEQGIIEKDEPSREANGLLVLTPEQYDYWVREAELYRKKREEEVKRNKGEDKIVEQDDTLKKKQIVTPVTFPTPDESTSKEKTLAPNIMNVINKWSKIKTEDKQEKEKLINAYIKNKPIKTNTSSNGFETSEEKKVEFEDIVDKVDEGEPFIRPEPPSFENLKKKDKTEKTNSTDSFSAYVEKRRQDQLSKERSMEELEIPIIEKPKEEERMEQIAEVFNFSLKGDSFFRHKKELPTVLLPEKLKAAIVHSAEEEGKTISQYIGYLYIREIYRKEIERN